MDPYWGETNGHASHSVKYESEAAVSSFPYCTESSLNFSTSATAYSEDDAEYATGRRNKTSRQDPLSHRIIEKRRRDRMNSCLADLSRLIPPQYQRKGRGRIEKTEIIEMAIRHLKHLQSECIQKENEYRLGYTDCMKEAAKFLYDCQMQEFCYRLVARLQEHCDEVIKNECFKTRCHLVDNVSASSGSPHNVYHPAAPLSQLRDMLASDVEHSIDHNDVKDLSFRNHLNHLNRNSSGNISSDVIGTGIDGVGGANNCVAASPIYTINNNNSKHLLETPPNQATVITSTAPTSLHHHADSSNHDFDSSREPMLHHETANMHSPPLSHRHHNHHHLHSHNLRQHSADSLLMQAARMRNFSESSHDIEHNNNYKYKNHIKERFNQDVHLHDDETSSEHCIAPTDLLQSEHSHTHSMSEHSKDDDDGELDVTPPIDTKKRKLMDQVDISEHESGAISRAFGTAASVGTFRRSLLIEAKPPLSFSDIKAEITGTTGAGHGTKTMASAGSGVAVKHHQSTITASNSSSAMAGRHFAVPIFALHGQGTFYIPLSVDYNVLVPFLNGIDLFEKNYTNTMPVVHPININVNFLPTIPSASLLAAAAAVAAIKRQPQAITTVTATTTSSITTTTTTPVLSESTTASPASKSEAIPNGW